MLVGKKDEKIEKGSIWKRPCCYNHERNKNRAFRVPRILLDFRNGTFRFDIWLARVVF